MLCEIVFTYLRMMYMAKTFITVTTMQLIAALSLNILFIVYMNLDILGIFYSTLITQAIVGLSLSCYILSRVGLRVSGKTLRELIRFGLPLVPSRIGLMLGFVSNRFFLRFLSSVDPTVALTNVGLYSLGHKFGVTINRFVNVPFNSFWSPRRLELLFKDEASARQIIARVCTYATMVSAYAALLLSVGVESLLQIIADPRYVDAYMVTPFVAASYVFLGLDSHFNLAMLYRKKTLYTTYITLASLVVVILWNLLFVPKYGLLGAATSNLAGFVVRVALTYYVGKRIFPVQFEIGRLGTIGVTAVVMYLGISQVSVESPYITLLTRTAIASMYPLVLLLVGFFHGEERAALHNVLRRYVLRRQQVG
jgi:O-antigen/teichoic acid export membrane protein